MSRTHSGFALLRGESRRTVASLYHWWNVAHGFAAEVPPAGHDSILKVHAKVRRHAAITSSQPQEADPHRTPLIDNRFLAHRFTQRKADLVVIHVTHRKSAVDRTFHDLGIRRIFLTHQALMFLVCTCGQKEDPTRQRY